MGTSMTEIRTSKLKFINEGSTLVISHQNPRFACSYPDAFDGYFQYIKVVLNLDFKRKI